MSFAPFVVICTVPSRAQTFPVRLRGKSGTLTAGKPEVTDRLSNEASQMDELLAAAAALEASSEHPLARAIVNAAKNESLPIPESSGFESTTGGGVSGQISGNIVRVGKKGFLEDSGVSFPENLLTEAERLQNDALQFRQQTQQQCDQLVNRSRQEAAGISEGANRYAEQVLGELEGRLKELGQVVAAGRNELVRLQVSEGPAPSDPAGRKSAAAAAAGQAGRTSPGSKRRRVVNTLRQLAG